MALQAHLNKGIIEDHNNSKRQDLLCNFAFLKNLFAPLIEPKCESIFFGIPY